MLLKDYIFVILGFGIIVILAGFMVLNLNQSYDTNATTEFANTYGTLDSLNETSTDLSNSLGLGEGIKSGSSITIIWDGVSTFFTVIKNTITLPPRLLAQGLILLKVPYALASVISVAITVAIIIAVVFAIASAINRSRI